MSTKLFVGNLSYSTREDKLTEVFSAFGAIKSVAVIIEKMTGRSKGFGFVEFENDEDAQKAIEQLNNTEIDGRSIIVNVARPMEERPRRTGGFGGDRGGFGGGSSRGGFGGSRGGFGGRR